MRNYIFLITTATNNRKQRIRVRSITPAEAETLAAAIMDNNGKTEITYWAEN